MISWWYPHATRPPNKVRQVGKPERESIQILRTPIGMILLSSAYGDDLSWVVVHVESEAIFGYSIQSHN